MPRMTMIRLLPLPSLTSFCGFSIGRLASPSPRRWPGAPGPGLALDAFPFGMGSTPGRDEVLTTQWSHGPTTKVIADAWRLRPIHANMEQGSRPFSPQVVPPMLRLSAEAPPLFLLRELGGQPRHPGPRPQQRCPKRQRGVSIAAATCSQRTGSVGSSEHCLDSQHAAGNREGQFSHLQAASR